MLLLNVISIGIKLVKANATMTITVYLIQYTLSLYLCGCTVKINILNTFIKFISYQFSWFDKKFNSTVGKSKQYYALEIPMSKLHSRVQMENLASLRRR